MSITTVSALYIEELRHEKGGSGEGEIITHPRGGRGGGLKSMMLEWVLCARPNFKSVCLFALFLLFTEYYRFSQFDKDEIALLVSVMECLRTFG
jgi:hypothetical protein